MKKGDIDNLKSVAMKGVESGVIKQKGRGFYRLLNKTYHGIDALTEALTKKPKTLAKLKTDILATLKED